ncbi:GNAT family N-acetyltransferase [uncultured Megasphaera sp.]|uniref:GNAT family N-acetyltransferase n=1 Tax=uncultured Megasphaera sp. TaxID=165188 RepID=UPI002658929B|nr:GNAT family N-acetyltransferase [uncultured Megasphaera sp.]
MQVKIRPARTSDLNRLADIESQCFPEAEAASFMQIKERLAAFRHSFFVAEDTGRVIGFINGCITAQPTLTDDLYASTRLHDDDAPNVMVFGLDVVPEAQHQGVAGQLMHAYIAEARRNGKERIILTCKRRLVSFYEQFGYVCQGKSQSLHGGAEWYDMTLDLQQL